MEGETGVKKYFTKNNYNLILSILSLIAFIFSIVSIAKINLGIGILNQINSIFPTTIWFLLFVSLVLSSILAYYEKYDYMILPIFLWLLIFTIQVRTANVPQLIDITTEEYTLGPDLDPFLYLRNAKEILSGTNVGEIDYMRYAPVGAPSYFRVSLMPWAIVGLYKLISLFSDASVTYAAIILPAILFSISLIGFFLFARLIFSFRLSKEKSSLVALIASFLYAFSPQMLHRTTGGIPEIESLAVAFFWFAFLFFALAWKNKEKKNWIIYGILAGIFTGLMSWSWGGYRYIYMILALTGLIVFIFDKEPKKNLIIFSSWLIPSLIIEFLKRKSVISIITDLSITGFAIGVLALIVLKEIIEKSKIKKLEKIKLPKSITAILIAAVLFLIILLVTNPKSILGISSQIVEGLLFPFGKGRVGLTVAENKAPYLVDAIQQLGYLVWVFLVSILIIFWESVKHFRKKERTILFGSFLIMLAAISFSRISESSILNGDNFLSSFIYIGGILIFVFVFLKILINGYKDKDEIIINNFKEVRLSYILLAVFSFWAIVSMRGAIRLFFIISPMVILVSSYLPVKLYEYARRAKDDLQKLILWISLIVILVVFIFSFVQYSQATISQAKATVPGIYEQQWQRAMDWVRENTLQGSIFAHWWDYGYWVQTIGERATVTDGGHYSSYWDHLSGRYLLTETKPEVAESYMKSYNATYLLIDSTDLGKYAAYSSIGSDENFDRLSSVTLMRIDNSQTRETNSTTMKVYSGTGGVDEDLIYNSEEKKITIPGPTYNEYRIPQYNGFVIGVIIEENFNTNEFLQPKAVFVYNNQQIIIPLRYLYYQNQIIDYGSGLDGVYMIIPQLYSSSGSLKLDEAGSGIYLSPKVSKSMFAQLYLLSNTDGLYGDFEIQHIEEDIITISLKQQGADVGYFVDYGGFRGPIKIWKMKDNPKIISHEEFLEFTGGYAELDELQFIR